MYRTNTAFWWGKNTLNYTHFVCSFRQLAFALFNYYFNFTNAHQIKKTM